MFEPLGEDADPLVVSLVELSSLLLTEESLDTTLNRVVVLVCEAIGPCDFASVTYVDGSTTHTVASTDPSAAEIDQSQYEHDSGPCLEALHAHVAISVPSMEDGDGWEQFRRCALDHGIGSCLSLPMVVREVSVGTLNLYAHEPGAFCDVARQSALLFAAQAAVAVWNARVYEHTRQVVEHLEVALETRDLIGQAKGVIMANEKVTAEAAFTILRDASQRQNVKLRELAGDVATTGVTPRG